MSSSLVPSVANRSEAEVAPLAGFRSASLQEADKRYFSQALESHIYVADLFPRVIVTVLEDFNGNWPCFTTYKEQADPDVSNVLMITYNPLTREFKECVAYTHQTGNSSISYVPPTTPRSRGVTGFDNNRDIEYGLLCHNLGQINEPDPALLAANGHNKAYICDLYKARHPLTEVRLGPESGRGSARSTRPDSFFFNGVSLLAL